MKTFGQKLKTLFVLLEQEPIKLSIWRSLMPIAKSPSKTFGIGLRREASPLGLIRSTVSHQFEKRYRLFLYFLPDSSDRLWQWAEPNQLRGVRGAQSRINHLTNSSSVSL